MSSSLVCEWCESDFDRPHTHGPIPKYCSESHRQQAYRGRQLGRFVEEVEIAGATDHDLAARNFLKGVDLNRTNAFAEMAKGPSGIQAAFAEMAKGPSSIQNAFADMAKQLNTNAFADMARMSSGIQAAFADLGKGFSTDTFADGSSAQQLAALLEVDQSEPAVGDAEMAPLVLLTAALGLLVMMRAQLEAAVFEIIVSIMEQIQFITRVAAEIQDESPEVRGVFGIVAVTGLLVSASNALRRLGAESEQGSSSKETQEPSQGPGSPDTEPDVGAP